jgi:hypothetical protein
MRELRCLWLRRLKTDHHRLGMENYSLLLRMIGKGIP